MPDPSPGGPRAALEALAAALDAREFATTLVTGDGRDPYLAVASRCARLSEYVYARDGWFCWGWGERMTPMTDVSAAAAKVTAVLRTIPEPTRA